MTKEEEEKEDKKESVQKLEELLKDRENLISKGEIFNPFLRENKKKNKT